VTFLGGTGRTGEGDPALAMAALDNHIVSVVSRGKSADGGGDEEGIPTKAAHSYAISWVEVLERAMQWNLDSPSQGSVDDTARTITTTAAPMLVVAAVAPLLAQAGSAYVRHVDLILSSTTVAASPRSPAIIQMMPMAHYAATFKDCDDGTVSPREQHHLKALHHLLNDEHRQALECYQKILQLCPGDALALSLALDVSSTLSDGAAALRAATSVASYWNERGRRGLPGVTNAVQPGHSIGTALIAVGYAAGGRYVEAERLAEEALARDDAGAGGVAVWALAAAYDAEGRASEGTSMLGGYDGMQHYEKCGHLFHDSILSGYGARFALDRDAAGAGRSAGRIYESAFQRIIQYDSEPDTIASVKMAPRNQRALMIKHAGGAAKSMFSSLFGGGSSNTNTDEPTQQSDSFAVERPQGTKRTAIDALTWLPPSPQVLTEATMLLLRLTFGGTISEKDYRWRDLKAAWEKLFDLHPKETHKSSALAFYPLARVASSLVLGNKDLTNGNIEPVFNKLAEGAYLLGRAMNLGGEGVDSDTNNEATKEAWKTVANCLAEARRGQIWDMDARVLLDQGLCHAAVLSDDFESLCLARSVCSESVSLRPNSPESWWRYSVVLDRLGDENAAEDARGASVSLGSGEGGRL
jgi:tetratricopeptide (TPR) repeat protein